MEGIFIPNSPQGDRLNDTVVEDGKSKLVRFVEEIASAMLQLAVEFGERGFLQREFLVYLRMLMREITGEVQPQPGAADVPPSVPQEIEIVCPHPEHHLPPEIVVSPPEDGSRVYEGSTPRNRRNSQSPTRTEAAGDNWKKAGPTRMQSPERLGALRKVPATVYKMERPVPSTPMNVTFALPQGGTTGRKYTYDQLSPISPGSQDYSDATIKGELAPQPGRIIRCRLTPVDSPTNERNYGQRVRPSPKQNLFGQAAALPDSPMNDSCYCKPLPATPMTGQRASLGRRSSARRPRPGPAPQCTCPRR